MRRGATTWWALGAVVACATAAVAQTPARPAPTVVYRTGAAREAPTVQVWVVHTQAQAGAGAQGRSYDPYDPVGFDDRDGTARAYFRVSDDAYVTVALIGSGGRVRIIHPQYAGELRPVPARVTRSARLDGAASGDGDWSDWGYVAAIASYGAPDYADYTRQGEWRSRTVARPAIDDPAVAVDELARQLYPDGGDYAVDFAFYRTPYRDYARASRGGSHRSCATFGYDWTFAPWELLSAYDVGCWHPGWGYYGWAPLGPSYPAYPGYPPPRRYRPPRGSAPDGAGPDDGRWAARDAARGRRPASPRGSRGGTNPAGGSENPAGGPDADQFRPPHTVDRGRLRASPPDDRVHRTDDPPRVVRSPADPRSIVETRDGWRVGAPQPSALPSASAPAAGPSRSQPTRSEPARSEPVRTEPVRAEPARSKPATPSAGGSAPGRPARSDPPRVETRTRPSSSAGISRAAPSPSAVRTRPAASSAEPRARDRTRPRQ